MSMLARLAAFVLATCSWISAQGAVWVVDDDAGPDVDFTRLQPAIDAAADGDTILLKRGTYVGLHEIDGKGLSLVSEGPNAEPRIQFLTVKNTAAHQTVVLRGLTITGTVSFLFNLWLLDCDGLVWMEDCRMDPTVGGVCQALRCEQVVLVRCEFLGGKHGFRHSSHPPYGSYALQASSSNVHAHGCRF